jgi:tRNA (adenine37-N6)-methyltransferase
MPPIATLRTPFPEKFGIPRQSGIVEEAVGVVEFLPAFASADFIRGIESFSHLWLITHFHESAAWDGSATVRPPRLGGNERVGVFASRSPNRPNPIGLSLVRLLRVEASPSVKLHVAGVDAVDGTPVLDIKPYLPWCESVPDAKADWAGESPTERAVEQIILPDDVRAKLENSDALPLIARLLRLSLKPAYHDDPSRIYGMSVAGWNVRWTDDGEIVRVLEATPL